MDGPKLIPSYGLIWQRQEFVIEYPYDLPDPLMTLTIYHQGSNDPVCSKIPTNPLGPRAKKALLPSFQAAGIYILVPKFLGAEDPNFPPFELRVLSPTEALLQTLTPEDSLGAATSPSQNSRAVFAALLAYHVQREQQGLEESSEVMDEILSQIFPSLDNPIVSIVKFLCGKYSEGEETLLHYCIRHRYMKMCKTLSEPYGYDYTGFETSLSMSGFDGKTPLELSETFNIRSLTTSIERAMERLSETEKSDFDDEKKLGASIEQLVKKNFGRIKNVITKRHKSKMSTSDDMEQEEDTYNSSSDGISNKLLNQLKVTALYAAKVIAPYSGMDRQFGPIKLEVDDVVFVTREEDEYWCSGIVNNSFCRFPRNVLQRLNYEETRREPVPSPTHPSVAEQRLSTFHPLNITHSRSVETGLDEIGNQSPRQQRQAHYQLQNTQESQNAKAAHFAVYQSHRGMLRRDVPLPAAPTQEQEYSEESDDSDYEKAEFPPLEERQTKPKEHLVRPHSQRQLTAFVKHSPDIPKKNADIQSTALSSTSSSPRTHHRANASPRPSTSEQDDESDPYDTVSPRGQSPVTKHRLQEIRKKVEGKRNREVATTANVGGPQQHRRAPDEQSPTEQEENNGGYVGVNSSLKTAPVPPSKPKQNRRSTTSSNTSGTSGSSNRRSTTSSITSGGSSNRQSILSTTSSNYSIEQSHETTTSTTPSIAEADDESVEEEYEDAQSVWENYQSHQQLMQLDKTTTSTASEDYVDAMFYSEKEPKHSSLKEQVIPPAVKEKPKCKISQEIQSQVEEKLTNELKRHPNFTHAPLTPPLLRKPLPPIPTKQETKRPKPKMASEQAVPPLPLKIVGPKQPMPSPSLKSPGPKQPMTPPPLKTSAPPLPVPKFANTNKHTTSFQGSSSNEPLEMKKGEVEKTSIQDRITMFENN